MASRAIPGAAVPENQCRLLPAGGTGALAEPLRTVEFRHSALGLGEGGVVRVSAPDAQRAPLRPLRGACRPGWGAPDSGVRVRKKGSSHQVVAGRNCAPLLARRLQGPQLALATFFLQLALVQDEDTGWAHPACLASLMSELAAEDVEHSLERARCNRCKAPYRVKSSFHFVCDCAHVLREQALGHLTELASLVLTLLVTALALAMLMQDAADAKETEEHPQSDTARRFRLRHRGRPPTPQDVAWVELGFVLALIAVVLVGWRLVARFRRASSDLELRPT